MGNSRPTSKLPHLLCTSSLLCNLFAFDAHAQFKKYKSPTKFDASNAANAANAQAPESDPGNQIVVPGNPGAPAAMPENAGAPPGSENMPTQKSAADLLDKAVEDQENQLFGRSGQLPTGPSKKDNKFVTLNPETAFGPEVVTSFDFHDTSLIDLTKHMQKLTGINLILDKDIKGKITITAPTPITVGDAWKAYLAALNINGYTLVKTGAFYKVVNARDIRYTPTNIYTGNYTPSTENYVMRIVPLKYIRSSEVTRSFRPFMSRYGRLIDISQTNTIIAQDTGININRLVQLIKFVDVPGHEESLQVIKVNHSSAQEIAKLLEQILGGARGRGGRPPGGRAQDSNISNIIAEPRTNSIIAMANAEGAKQLRHLIQKLDVRGLSATSGRIHVYYLNHSDAESLAKTLSSLVQSVQDRGGSAGAGGSRFSRGAVPDDSTLFTADVKITADKDNNAIVVTASPTDFLTIKNVITKLDIPRDQVYVEGLIMETNVSKNRALGINIIGVYGTGGTQKFGFTNTESNADLMALLTNNITSLGGLFGGIGVGRSLELDVGGKKVNVNTVNGLIKAIATHGNTNVLATPQVMAMDNTEAVFEVGEQVPFPQQNTTINGTTSVSTQYQDVTLKIKITPQINKVTRFVKLKIDQSIKDFSGRSLPSGLQNSGLATTVRNTVTTITVRDKDTIAMGGLMRDKETAQESKVPLLGDIPVLGWLFKNSSKAVEKVNLMFFLTPKIMSSYQKTVASNLKDLLNRRGAHLKNVLGEDDPFKSTVKGLYQKAEKQAEGPLYDMEDAAKYLRENESSGINRNSVQNGIAPETQSGGQVQPGINEINEASELPEPTTPPGSVEPMEGAEVNLVPENASQGPALEAPDYQDIVQEVKASKAGVQR